MTGRARWLLLIGLVGILSGVMRFQPTLALLSLSVFTWILCLWCYFQWCCWRQLPRLTVTRLVNGRAKPEDTLWAGRLVRIELTIRCPARMQTGIRFRDVVPEIFELEGHSGSNDGPQKLGKAGLFGRSSLARMTGDGLSSGLPPNELELEAPARRCVVRYSIRCRAAGVARLPGVRVTMCDRLGFFRKHRFVDAPQRFRILPAYFHASERSPTVKRVNSLPRHGIHRLQRSGLGSELLELREYVPGDPPKSIAWKVSARRDSLMTRRYESEVPVRINLLIDGSITTRIGGYGLRLMDQLNYVAASVAKAALSVGDPVSGVLVDEDRSKQLPWVTGDRGFLQLLTELAEFSDTPPPPAHWLSSQMLEYAEAVCLERYPELMDRRYHRNPFSLFAARRRRIRLAAVVSELYHLEPNEQFECYHEPKKLAIQIRRLLHDAGLPWMPPLLSSLRISNFSATHNVRRLATALARGIATAKDNQVFVVFADVLSCAPNLDQLVKVVKLALAKHHRVALVCPTTTVTRPESGVIRPDSDQLADLLQAAEQARIRELAAQVRRELRRLGVPVSFSGQESAIQMVISEIELARDGRSRGVGVSVS